MAIESSIFLVLQGGEATYNRETSRYDGPPRDFNVVAMRKSKPALAGNQVAVQLTLQVDPSLFSEYIPKLVATIEGSSVIVAPEVTVVSQAGD